MDIMRKSVTFEHGFYCCLQRKIKDWNGRLVSRLYFLPVPSRLNTDTATDATKIYPKLPRRELTVNRKMEKLRALRGHGYARQMGLSRVTDCEGPMRRCSLTTQSVNSYLDGLSATFHRMDPKQLQKSPKIHSKGSTQNRSTWNSRDRKPLIATSSGRTEARYPATPWNDLLNDRSERNCWHWSIWLPTPLQRRIWASWSWKSKSNSVRITSTGNYGQNCIAADRCSTTADPRRGSRRRLCGLSKRSSTEWKISSVFQTMQMIQAKVSLIRDFQAVLQLFSNLVRSEARFGCEDGSRRLRRSGKYSKRSEIHQIKKSFWN